MEAKEQFNEIINDAISKLSKGISNKVDAALMSDLKRMSDLGVLEIHATQPSFENIEMDISKRKFTVTQSKRLYFKGEETILQLQTELKEARERIEETSLLLTHLRPIYKEDSETFEKYEKQRLNYIAK
jgi:hypothetical protein